MAMLIAIVALTTLVAALALSASGRQDRTAPFVRPSVVPVISPPMASLPFDPCRPPTARTVIRLQSGFDPASAYGRIAYRSGMEIRAVDPVDPARDVLLVPSLDADPSMWSADGSRLLMIGAGKSFPNELTGPVVLTSDGQARMLTDSGLGSFAPDGKTVVYETFGTGLCYVQADGTGYELLTFDLGEPLDGG
ncbi:MAG TPA: hypothetical protein VFP66_05895, partial [Candidatus Limnocylindrales bacterium]|nr:hypothetical protein [Candidatus Limnocylindrales bacterium]